MTVARTNHKTNTVLGNGEIYVDVLDADGNLQGERYLGDSVGATISIASERTTIQSGDGAVAQDLVDIVRSVSRTAGFTLRDSSIANWALFLLGEEGTQTIAAAEKTSARVKIADVGRWYQLGQTDANPSGDFGAVSLGDTNPVKLYDAATGGSATNQADGYEVDLATGRIKFTAAAAKGKYFTVTYTPTAQTRTQARGTGDASQITCALRYIEDKPAAGKGRNVYIRKCNLVPGGDAALKSRDTEQQMAFTATVQDPGGGVPAIVIDGEELS